MAYELHTFITALPPLSCGVRLTELTVVQEYVLLQLTAMVPTACCPRCAMPSSSVHSRYQRQLADLPGSSLAVRIRLTVRKFVCRNPSCAPYLHGAPTSACRGICPQNPAIGHRSAGDRRFPWRAGRRPARRLPAAADQCGQPPPAGAGGSDTTYVSPAGRRRG
jgi:zinc-finger of transposase IS204/IS1001/IS1096/IS1165